MYSNLHSTSLVNIHHKVAIFKVDEMVQNTKVEHLTNET